VLDRGKITVSRNIVPFFSLVSQISRGSRDRNTDSRLANLIATRSAQSIMSQVSTDISTDDFSRNAISRNEILIYSWARGHVECTPKRTRGGFGMQNNFNSGWGVDPI
jgi:hypothetical protein